MQSFPQVFSEGVGSLPGEQHLKVDPNAKPSVNAVRRVPYSLVNDLKKELNQIEEDKVITKVNTPTPWESSLVTQKKPNGKLRVCLDPQKLNTALKREHYYMPVLDDILPKLQNAKIFSVLDLKVGYWHVKLDEESSYLTAFNTPFGRYRWLWIPFGINPAAEIFQRRLHQTLEDFDGIACIADDIVVIGNGDTEEEARMNHDKCLLALLRRYEEIGIKKNSDKMQLRKKSIKFRGHLVTSEGLKPDPEKVEAIQMMKEPSNVTELRRYLEFIQYLARFLPNLTDQIEPFRKLTKSDTKWVWGEDEKEAFKSVKELIMKEPVLHFYNPEEELEIQCDASDTGLGTKLMQASQPIAHKSHAMTSIERNYAPIEKEMLAIVWSVEVFHQYTYGHNTKVNQVITNCLNE